MGEARQIDGFGSPAETGSRRLRPEEFLSRFDRAFAGPSPLARMTYASTVNDGLSGSGVAMEMHGDERIQPTGVAIAHRIPPDAIWSRRRWWRLVAAMMMIYLVLAVQFPDIIGRRPSTAGPVSAADTSHEGVGHGDQIASDMSKASGIVEPVPRNVFHASPYNDWPLFELRVHEGQRLKFHREGGKWTGDEVGLFIQFETPAEIDGKEEDVEIAQLEERTANIARDSLREEMQKGIEAAKIREANARQQLDRLDRVLARDRSAVATAEHDRARNMHALARTQLDQQVQLFAKKLEMLDLEVDLADRRLRRAKSELVLAEFKREMSWAKVPVARGQFEEVVVTKVQAHRGDTPGIGGKRDVWVEVIDDRVLQVRSFVCSKNAEALRPGGKATVRQANRTYVGEVLAIGAVADRVTHQIPILVTVSNHDRALKIYTEVSVDFVGSEGAGR